MTTKRVARLFTIEQKFPCGPKSSCCGPVGQSTEQVTLLKNAIEGLGLGVEIYDLSAIPDSTENAPVLKLFKTFGPQVTPIISLDGQVVAMGQSDINETVSTIKGKL